ncbi:MAG TPA: polysaccharide deacetylase family protein [Flavisolibacter sp.]|nr:polysaccharide deacetylase family protein [Flavisolibacter sp.]
MHRYFIKTPWWVKKLFSSYVWSIPSTRRIVYLTFDDGPHPTITPWVLAQLKKHKAKATFFCIGKNVVQHPDVYRFLIDEGHAVGNHTYQHLNGWKTATQKYLADVSAASEVVTTGLFRPPYGKITKAQAKGIARAMNAGTAKVIMWDVLSADFDTGISARRCAYNVLKNVSPGSIVVFHDSEKAFVNLETALPLVLNTLGKKGYRFEKIVMEEV